MLLVFIKHIYINKQAIQDNITSLKERLASNPESAESKAQEAKDAIAKLYSSPEFLKRSTSQGDIATANDSPESSANTSPGIRKFSLMKQEWKRAGSISRSSPKRESPARRYAADAGTL